MTPQFSAIGSSVTKTGPNPLKVIRRLLARFDYAARWSPWSSLSQLDTWFQLTKTWLPFRVSGRTRPVIGQPLSKTLAVTHCGFACYALTTIWHANCVSEFNHGGQMRSGRPRLSGV